LRPCLSVRSSQDARRQLIPRPRTWRITPRQWSIRTASGRGQLPMPRNKVRHWNWDCLPPSPAGLLAKPCSTRSAEMKTRASSVPYRAGWNEVNR